MHKVIFFYVVYSWQLQLPTMDVLSEGTLFKDAATNKAINLSFLLTIKNGDEIVTMNIIILCIQITIK